MLITGVVDSAATHTLHEVSSESSWHLPACVAAALKNVRLCPEHTEPPMQHTGEFWHWKLTPYGLDLMRALVRASRDGFSYQETIIEPEQAAVPQLALMMTLNSAIHSRLAEPDSAFDWAALLYDQPFLREHQIEIDSVLFHYEVERLIRRILNHAYAETGSRLYRHPRLRSNESEN